MSRRAALAAAFLTAAALWFLSARASAVGSIGDDALYILLARALRHGAFVDPSGRPVTDPLPGFAALLTWPTAWAAPRWTLLRWLNWPCALAALATQYALARRWFSAERSAAAAAWIALCPGFVAAMGRVVPDAALLAASLGALLLFERRPRLAAALAGWAALTRPEGALSAAAIALALAAVRRRRDAAVFGVLSLGPLGLWLLRNRLAARSVTGYADHLAAQAAALAGMGAQARHALAVVSRLLGEGLLGAPAGWLAAAAGLAALAAAGYGLVTLLRRSPSPLVLALALQAIALLALHQLWVPVETRYGLMLAPALALGLLAALDALPPSAAAGLGLALLTGPALAGAVSVAPGLRGQAEMAPRTMRWLLERTEPTAVVETLETDTVTLLTGKRAVMAGGAFRDAYLASALAAGARYAFVDRAFRPAGYWPDDAWARLRGEEAWLRSTPYARQVLDEPREGAAVYALSHPRPAEFALAWKLFLQGLERLSAGDRAAAAGALRQAVAREPRLACAWSLLASVEDTPKDRERARRRAAAEDPTGPWARDIR